MLKEIINLKTYTWLNLKYYLSNTAQEKAFKLKASPTSSETTLNYYPRGTEFKYITFDDAS